MTEVNFQNNFLRREREILCSFRQSVNQLTHAENEAANWRRNKVKDANDRLKDAENSLTNIRNTATQELDKAREAVKDAEDVLYGIELKNKLKQAERTKVSKPINIAIEDVAREVADHSSAVVETASSVVSATEKVQNWRLAAREKRQLNKSLLLLSLSSLGFVFFLFGIIGEAGFLIFLGLASSPILLAFADSVWNLGKKEPGKNFSKGYLFLWLVAPIAPFVAIYWIFASYPASLVAISKRYRPRAPKYKVAREINSLCPRLVHTLAEAELFHDVLQEQVQQQRDQAQQEYRRSKEQIEMDYKQKIAEAKSIYETAWQQIDGESKDFSQDLGLVGASWDNPIWESWTPSKEGKISPEIRIGQLVEQSQWQDMAVPALVPIIGGRNLVIRTPGIAREQVVQIVQSLMLRLLVTVPPGKLRFTLIDPVGLGQSMATFMSLADHDESLVGNKIWTESQHIEEQLARLTEHMEFVIQKFLRDKFDIIEDYNAEAGEVAEPYRVLVVVNFPVNFTESATRRLMSIALNGPRCGVYTVIAMDTEQQLP